MVMSVMVSGYQDAVQTSSMLLRKYEQFYFMRSPYVGCVCQKPSLVMATIPGFKNAICQNFSDLIILILNLSDDYCNKCSKKHKKI